MDTWNLQRFVDAQRPVWDQALAELRAGRKHTHWMWFVFPQLEGLGNSAMARRYALRGRDEALAYLLHPLLGPRLEEATRALFAHQEHSAHDILGSPDDLKLRSCLTLFTALSPAGSLYQQALARFFPESPCEHTLTHL